MGRSVLLGALAALIMLALSFVGFLMLLAGFGADPA
jgi:hypothetical protein